MLRISLLPKKIAEARRKRRMQALMILVGLLIVAILAGLVLRLQVTINSLQKQKDGIQKSIKAHEKKEKEISTLGNQMVELENRRQVLRGLLRLQAEWLSTLDILAEVLPDNMWYEKLDGRKKGDALEIVLEGMSLSDNEVFELTERLQREKDFIQVTLEDIKERSSRVGYATVWFRMRLVCKPRLKHLPKGSKT